MLIGLERSTVGFRKNLGVFRNWHSIRFCYRVNLPRHIIYQIPVIRKISFLNNSTENV